LFNTPSGHVNTTFVTEWIGAGAMIDVCTVVVRNRQVQVPTYTEGRCGRTV